MSATSFPVDIIIPVYKGLSDTMNCLESVLQTQEINKTSFNVIVINDASPEQDVTDWLRGQNQKGRPFTLLENEVNLGFVGTVNRGMALSPTNDVLLLNSDTVVANDWMDRILQAAYSASNIGTVTPFSTNATICSYPLFCQDNPLLDGMDTAAMDKLCAATNSGQLVDVPTGVGFCMYIRRDCLTKTGLFDVQSFGKGYGEENDFCQRAIKAGWRNVHLLDTFVLHTGGVSFGQTKSPREQAAMETMRRLHPRYEADVMAFVRKDPAREARRALDIARIQRRARQHPLILHVAHNRGGGTMRHVKDLAKLLAPTSNSLVLTPALQGLVSLKLADDREEFELFFDVHSEYERLVAFLKNLGVAHVHFHHVLGHASCIFELPQLLGVLYDVTVHDYYALCLNISLINNKGVFMESQPDGNCSCCQEDEISPFGTPLHSWRNLHRFVLENARQVFVPSMDVKKRFERFAPTAKLVAVYHPDLPLDALPDVVAPQTSSKLRVLVIGALSKIKGADMLEEVAVEAKKTSAAIEFHLVGYSYRNLKKIPHANLFIHGPYEEEDLAGIIEQISPHVAWFPSQCPETYSYTLSACLNTGLPVVTTDLGALPERIANRAWSWVLPWQTDSKTWLQLFENIRIGKAQTKVEQRATSGEKVMCGQAYYPNAYLAGISPSQHAFHTVEAKFIEQHCRNDEVKSLHMLALKMLIRLRSAPFLSQASKFVPLSLQRKVKNWLLR